MWSNKYIGIPYKARGRDHSGVDCWGLVRLIYAEQYNISLPSLAGNYTEDDNERISELISMYQEGWETTPTPEVGDIVLFRVMGEPTHLGVVIEDNRFIHSILNKNVAVENLSSISWSKRILGYYRYKASSTNAVMNVSPHPLKTQTFNIPIPPGTSIQQVVNKIKEEYNISDELKKVTTIILNGKVVEPLFWLSTFVKHGDTIEYRAVPEGGDTFRMFLMVALVFAAPYATAALSGLSVGAGTLGAAVAGQGLAAIAATAHLSLATVVAINAGVMIAGSLLINAIAPIRVPSQKTPEEGKKLYLATGNRNQLLPYESIPVVLGKVRMTPPLGAENITRYQNETDAYLDSILIWGYGPLQIDLNTLKIGEIPFSEYTDKKEITLDYITEPTATRIAEFDSIYGKDIDQETIQNGELTCEGDPSAAEPIQLAPVPGPWRTAEVNLGTGPENPALPRTLELAISFPQGLRRIKSKGNDAGEDFNAPTVFELEWRQGTTGPYNPLPELKIGGRPTYEETVTETYSDESGDSTRSYTRKVVGTDSVKIDGFVWYNTYQLPFVNGVISVRIRRMTGDATTPEGSDYQWVHSAFFQSMKVITNRRPVENPPGCKIARTAVTIKATNQLNGNLEGYNAIVQTYCKSWNGSAWIDRATNNPADLFRYILTHPANPRRIEDDQNLGQKINLGQIQYWAQYCITKGFQYNSVEAGGRSIMEILRDICAAGRASPALVDGRWTVVIDEPKNITVQHFTPHNSWGFESTKLVPQLPHALRVEYIDENQNYQQAEVIQPLPGYTKNTASLFESITLPGVTKESLVVDHLKWHIAQVRLRPEIYTLNTDIEYIVCNRGDRVKVAHDVPLWGLGSGRIKNIVVPGFVYDLDEQVYIDISKEYTFRIRPKTGGNSVTRSIDTSFNFTKAERNSDGLVLTMQEYFPIKEDDVVSITSDAGLNINLSNVSVLSVDLVLNTITLDIPGDPFNPTNYTGVIALTSSTYTRVKFSTNSSTSQVDSGDLFLFGEVNRESQDLIVLGIEPLDNKTARITLTDYGVSTNSGSPETDYNIFNDYLNLSPNTYFNTNITLPGFDSRNQYTPTQYPIVIQIFSGVIAINPSGTGNYSYNIKVAYRNLDQLTQKTKYVQCEYDLTASTGATARSITVPYEQGIITIPGVVQGRSYRVRLRYLTEDGVGGPWTIWYTHLAQGFIDNNNLPLQISVDRITRYLEITPYIDTGDYIPPDFKTFEYRIYKNQGNPAEDFWDSVPVTDPNMIVTYSAAPVRVNLRDFTAPRLSLAGVQYRIACRVVTVANKYSSSPALASVVITSLI